MYPRKQNHICLILSVNGDQAGIPGDMTECFSASSGFRLRSYLPHRENPDLSQQLKSSLSVPLCVLLFVTVFSYLTLIIIRKFSFVKRILTAHKRTKKTPLQRRIVISTRYPQFSLLQEAKAPKRGLGRNLLSHLCLVCHKRGGNSRTASVLRKIVSHLLRRKWYDKTLACSEESHPAVKPCINPAQGLWRSDYSFRHSISS